MDGDKLSSMSNVEEISFNQEQFELYLNYCEQLEALQREHHLAKSLALAKMNFALRYGKYLTDSQLEDLLSITAESLITRLIAKQLTTAVSPVIDYQWDRASLEVLDDINLSDTTLLKDLVDI